jgi:hypothetical protein
MSTSKSKYESDNRTRALQRLRETHPELTFPVRGAVWIHSELCNSHKYFQPCNCDCRLKLANGFVLG